MASQILAVLPTYTSTGFKFVGAQDNAGSIISDLIPYIYVAAGLSMLVVLIMGGLTLMTAAGDQAKVKDGYGKITAAIIGFLIVFVSYFAVQIAEVVLGVKIF